MTRTKAETTYINANTWGISTIKRLIPDTRYKVIYQKSGQIILKPEKKHNEPL